MKEILDALNTQERRMRLGEVPDIPIAFRQVRLDDTIINDRLITDDTITDVEERIEFGHFESGNFFAMTTDEEMVYCSDRISRKLNPLFFVITERQLDKAMQYHAQMRQALQNEIKYLNAIVEKTSAYIIEINNLLVIK